MIVECSPPPGPHHIAGYVLCSFIDSGAFGEVCLVKSQETGRDFAIKRFSTDDASVVAQFHEERDFFSKVNQMVCASSLNPSTFCGCCCSLKKTELSDMCGHTEQTLYCRFFPSNFSRAHLGQLEMNISATSPVPPLGEYLCLFFPSRHTRFRRTPALYVYCMLVQSLRGMFGLCRAGARDWWACTSRLWQMT